LDAARPADRAAARRAREALPGISERLRRAGASSVFLFGSLARGAFRVSSDIDIAIEGLSPWKIASLEEELREASKERVDLVPLESVQPWLRDAIEREGERLV
jgi:predicted nucleotidyltransferase